jgi:hypothetical protein
MIGITLAFTAVLAVQEPGTVVAADTRVQARSYVFAETGKTIPYALRRRSRRSSWRCTASAVPSTG